MNNKKSFKETINRLNPVDFQVYNNQETNDEYRIAHKNNEFLGEEKISNTNFYGNSNKKSEDANQSYFSEINFKNTNNPFGTKEPTFAGLNKVVV